MNPDQLPAYLQKAIKVEPKKEKEQIPQYLSKAKALKSISGQEEEQFPFENEDDLEREIERVRAQQTSRMVERGLGLPGDILSLGQSLTGLGQKEIPLTPEERQKQGIPEGTTAYRKENRKFLPTSEDLRKLSEEVSGGYTKPQTQFEEQIGDYMGDVASRIIGPANFFTTAIVPAIGYGVKNYSKSLGLDDSQSGLAKMGIEVVLDLASLGNARQAASFLYDRARNLGRGLSLNAQPILNSLHALRDTWRLSGRTRTATNIAAPIERDLRNAITNNRLSADSIMDFRHRINDARRDLGHFTVGGGTRDVGSRGLNELDRILNEAVDHIGQVNPQFLQEYRSANQAWAAYNQSNVISNFISKNYLSPLLASATKALFNTVSLSSIPINPFAAAAYPTYKALQVIWRVSRSPVLARHYAGVLSAASKNQVGAMRKNLEKLDDALLEEESEGKFQ